MWKEKKISGAQDGTRDNYVKYRCTFVPDRVFLTWKRINYKVESAA